MMSRFLLRLQVPLALLLLLAGCDGVDEPELPVFEGTFTALKDGEPWVADQVYGSLGTRSDSTGKPVDRVYIRGVVFDELGLEDESVSFGGPFRGEGRYEMVSSRENRDHPYGQYLLLDGDGVLATYELFAPDTSFFVITGYDAASGVVEGTFAMTLERTFLTGHDSPPPPDMLRLTAGRFRVLLEDRR